MQIQTLKAKDLRIGNYVIFNTNQNPFQITPAGLLELSQIEGKPNPYFYEPIEITDEWFLKLGFTFKTEELGARFYEKQVGIDFMCFSKDGHWNINSGKSYWYMDRNFKSPKYVHELQNLYYALTGVELSVS
jgi:hypothetical protein